MIAAGVERAAIDVQAGNREPLVREPAIRRSRCFGYLLGNKGSLGWGER